MAVPFMNMGGKPEGGSCGDETITGGTLYLFWRNKNNSKSTWQFYLPKSKITKSRFHSGVEYRSETD